MQRSARMAVNKENPPSAAGPSYDSNTFGNDEPALTNDVDTMNTSLQQSIKRVIQPSVPCGIYIHVMMLVVQHTGTDCNQHLMLSQFATSEHEGSTYSNIIPERLVRTEMNLLPVWWKC